MKKGARSHGGTKIHPTTVPNWNRHLIDLGMAIAKISYAEQAVILRGWKSELDRQSIADEKRGRPMLAHQLFVAGVVLKYAAEGMTDVSQKFPSVGMARIPRWKKSPTQLGKAIGRLRYDKQIDVILGWRVELKRRYWARPKTTRLREDSEVVTYVTSHDHALWQTGMRLGGLRLALEDLFTLCKPHMEHEFLLEAERLRRATGKCLKRRQNRT